MMWRSNTCVQFICIIWMLFNCSANADDTKFAKATTVNRPINDVPTASLFVINGNHEASNIKTNIRPSSFQHDNPFDYAHKTNFNESSQRNAGNLVLLSKLPVNYLENPYENSETQSIVESSRHKRTTEQDMCSTGECQCKTEAKQFLTVDCNFRQDYTLDASKKIKREADSLLITLASGVDFHLDGNILSNNRLNRIKIQGNGADEHVEIRGNAFYGNMGPFPEIEIVNVGSVNILSNAFYREFKLNISNCANVKIFSEAFANTTFHGHFESILDLQLLEHAFSKSSAKITIHNCHMNEVEQLDAKLKEIKFSNTQIGKIRTRAFDVYSIDSIVFDNCNIDTIEANAFTEKLFSNQLSLTNCNIGTIQSDAILGSGITDFIMHNNSITTIKGKAIRLTSVTALIQWNNISVTELFWFRIEEWCTVQVNNNHFGVFERYAVEVTKNAIQCAFENNYITKTVMNSLNFKDPHCRVRQVSFDRACSCNSTYFRHLSDIDIGAESFCRIDSTLAHCFNASLYNVKSYKDDICDDSAQIDCVRDRINAKANGYFIDLDRLFNRNDKLLYVGVGAAIILIIVIVLLLILICRRCVRTKKDFDDGPTRDIVLMERLHPTSGTLTTQLYASQAFLDTDLIIINQTLKEMKQKYPPEIYDQMDNNTRKLIGGNLTEMDKVKTIGEIVQSINECENVGIDFIAFTDILYNHLGAGCETTQLHQVNGPIYAEPGLAHLDIINSTNGGRNNNNFVNDGEHIYAEPTNLQQPLLRSEYNVPVDNRISTSHMYSEPVTGAIDYVSSPRPTNPISPNFDPSHLYAQPSKSTARANPTVNRVAGEPSTSSTFASVNRHQPKISYLGEKFKNSTHSSSQESNNSHSDHSGASGVTLPLDEPIEYADA